ncbi:MAG: hypothetical protein AAFR02_04575, partial [Pseudomonadota bacterium]
TSWLMANDRPYSPLLSLGMQILTLRACHIAASHGLRRDARLKPQRACSPRDWSFALALRNVSIGNGRDRVITGSTPWIATGYTDDR